MLRELINHSPDLQRLHDEGYQMEYIGGHLVVRHIPYVNIRKEVKYGALVSQLTISGKKVAAPRTHVIYFIGDHPCFKDGSKIEAIRHGETSQNISEGLTVSCSFSNKPLGGYPNEYEKIKRYSNIISDQARAIEEHVTDRPYLPNKEEDLNSVFQYFDYNSSRAGINMISARLENQKIAIIGLGGTGAYILDFVAKTPVREIHLFDEDEFMTHNAFRSPGAASQDDLNDELKKVNYYSQLYSRMHKQIMPHAEKVLAENFNYLDGMSYVFIAIDKGHIKGALIKYLLANDISFIDVGIGVLNVNSKLLGQIRVTTGTPIKRDHLAARISMDDGGDDDYSSNIQIAELNALNATLAVIKWKKLSGFYQDVNFEYHTVYDINTSSLINDEEVTA